MDEGPSSAAPLYREAERAAVIDMLVSCLLGLAKLLAGIGAGAFALISDAVNSLGDALTAALVWAALRHAQRPADAEHPYGHSRAETIAASSVALLIVASGLWVAGEALARLGRPPAPAPPTWTIGLALVNGLAMEALFRFKLGVGRRTGSAATIAKAWDHRSDALSSLAVVIGLALAGSGLPGTARAGEAAALVVALVILGAGLQLFRDSASALMDAQAESDLLGEVRRLAGEVPGVRAVEKLYVRRTGLEHLADIHVQVDAELSVARGHEIGHAVKDHLVDRMPSLRDVLVHLEPWQGAGTAAGAPESEAPEDAGAGSRRGACG